MDCPSLSLSPSRLMLTQWKQGCPSLAVSHRLGNLRGIILSCSRTILPYLLWLTHSLWLPTAPPTPQFEPSSLARSIPQPPLPSLPLAFASLLSRPPLLMMLPSAGHTLPCPHTCPAHPRLLLRLSFIMSLHPSNSVRPPSLGQTLQPCVAPPPRVVLGCAPTCWGIGSRAAAGCGGAGGQAVGGGAREAFAGRQGLVEAGGEAAACVQHRRLF